MPRVDYKREAEKVVLAYDHAALTASLAVKLYKVPAGRTLRIDRISYINPTGLVEDTTNVFAGEVKNGAAALADAVFTAEADTELCTSVAHGMLTGAGPYRITTDGAVPTGLAVQTNYWIIRVSADTFQLASSLANALAGTAVAFSTDGTPTNTLVRNLITRLFNTDSDLSPDVGATLAVNTFLDFTADADVMSRTVAAGDIVSFVATEGGAATLPVGRLVLDCRLF